MVGGDYKAPQPQARHGAYSSDGGKTWKLAAQQPGGYRSAVAWVDGVTLAAVGPSGEDVSEDGGMHWKNTDSLNLNALAILDIWHGWAVGLNGTIAQYEESRAIRNSLRRRTWRRGCVECAKFEGRINGERLKHRGTEKGKDEGTEKLGRVWMGAECGERIVMRAMRTKKVFSWGATAILAAMMAMCCASWPAARAKQNGGAENGIAGTWAGVLGGRLHLVVTITQGGDGALGGTLNSVDQHSVLALSEVTLKDDAVRFEVPRVGGVYEGKLSKDGSKISGTWTQTGAPAQPLDFKRSAEASAAPSSALPASAVPAPAPGATHSRNRLRRFSIWWCRLRRWLSRRTASGISFMSCILRTWIGGMYAFTRIDVLPADASQKTLASFSGSELDGMFSHPGLPGAEKVAKLVPGEFGAVFMWVTFDKLEDVPASITHRISVKIGDYPEAYSVVTLPTSVNKNPVVVISPPLTGTDWVAANGPSNTSQHRRALILIDGRAYISQRFAIDWVQMKAYGKTYTGDPGDNKNYRAYGAEIHAVADGVVTQVKDGLPQNTPGAKSLAVPLSLETIGGNHVIMEIGDGLYAFYAHMQAGLAARESWGQGYAWTGVGTFGEHRKFVRAAFAFSDLQREFGVGVGGIAVCVCVV